MNRTIVYPGSIPLDTDLLNLNRNAMIALGALIKATLGTSTWADGLEITASTVPDMNVNIAPGSLTTLLTVDSAAYGSLGTNSAPLMKQGINLTSTVLALTAPGTVGQSINYLIQATLTEADGTPVVLPYYNASNPAVPYTGPAGAGTSQNTIRAQTVTISAKAGTPATTGTQTTPAADSGYVGLYVVAVAYGQTSITNTNLATAPSGRLSAAPIFDFKLPNLRPGFSVQQVFTSSGTFQVPANVTRIKISATGGGGGGAGGSATYAGGGGGSGGYTEGVFTVTPGTSYTVTIGAAGAAGASSAGGGNGGTTTFGALLTATGGSGGAYGANPSGGAAGAGSGGTINLTGGTGDDGTFNVSTLGGSGGASRWGGGGRAGKPTGVAGAAPGSGGGGGYGDAAAVGGAGAAGYVTVEY